MTSAEDTTPDDISPGDAPTGDASSENAAPDATPPADTAADSTEADSTSPAEAPGDGTPGADTPADEIARWMLETIRTEGRLDQDDAVRLVPEKFGPEWIRTSPNGHPALDREVVKAFRRAHDGTVQWDRDRRFWSPKR